VCLQDDASAATTLPCGHAFHVSCIIDWFRRGRSACPVCRATPEGARAPARSESIAVLTERGIRKLFRPLVHLCELGLLDQTSWEAVQFYLDAQRKLTSARRMLCYYGGREDEVPHVLRHQAVLLQRESDAEEALASAATRLLLHLGEARSSQLETALLRSGDSSDADDDFAFFFGASERI